MNVQRSRVVNTWILDGTVRQTVTQLLRDASVTNHHHDPSERSFRDAENCQKETEETEITMELREALVPKITFVATL